MLKKAQDARVALTTECLTNIKIIKIYGWTDIFKNLIKEKRKEELHQLARIFKIVMFLICFIFLFPQLLQTISFSSYIFFNGDLELSTAFFIISIFRMIIGPLRAVPGIISGVIQFKVSMERI